MNEYYKILGVDETVTDEQLRSVYRKLVKKYHPDKLNQYSQEEKKSREEQFKLIQQAYEYIKKSRAYRSNGNKEKKIDDLKEILSKLLADKKWIDIINIADKLLKLKEHDIDAYLYKAMAFKQLEKYKEAIMFFELAEKNGWECMNDLNLYFIKAVTYMYIHKYEEAINIIRKIIIINPKEALYISHLAYCYEMLGREEAYKYWEEVRNLNPNDELLNEYDQRMLMNKNKNKNKKSKGTKRWIVGLVACILLVIGAQQILENSKKSSKVSGNIDEVNKPKVEKEFNNTKENELNQRIEACIRGYLGENINDFSVAFKDCKSENALIINNKNWNSASMIKIYIMAEAYNQINQGRVNADMKVTITNDMKVGGSGSISTKEGIQIYSIEELIEYMIIDSDNTAANALIDIVGIENINNLIYDNGLNSTSINRKMMDQKEIEAGIINNITIEDLIKTFDKIEKGEFINEYYDKKMITILKKQKMRSKIPAKIPRSIEIANKTGELGDIENDGGIIYTDKGAYILVILADSDIENKREIIANLSKIIYDEYLE